MKSLSLFTGAGGMDVGFKNAGYQVVAANELDKHACTTFRKNHQNTMMIEGDIEKYMDRIAGLSDIDIIFGGPPCQGFSVAGKMDPDDPRSKLIFSFCSVVERLQPKAFVMENVKALGTLNKFAGVRQSLLSRFQKSGYNVTINVLNAKEFGVPQARERVFFIGVQQGFQPVYPASFEKHKKLAPTLREVLIPLGEPGTENNSRICKAKVTLAAKPVLRKSPYAGMLFNGQGRPLNPDGWASTLPASMGGNRTPIIDNNHLYYGKAAWVEDYHRRLISGGKPQGMHEAPAFLRRLTIDEAALLQTFPMTYEFSGPDSRVFSQIGNAVPCKLAEVVAKTVKSTLSGTTHVSPTTVRGENMELVFA